MNQTPDKPQFRTIVTILVLGFSIVLLSVGIVLIVNKPPSADAIAATMAAMPTPTALPTATPTPAPTLPGVSENLLVCQRNVGFALHKRNMVSAANISDDHLLLLSWVSLSWPIHDLDDALAGVILGFDAAIEVWKNQCAVYDRVRIVVWDRRQDEQIHRFTVQADVDELLAWQTGELSDKELIMRLQVTEP
jgi:hypothetical protein